MLSSCGLQILMQFLLHPDYHLLYIFLFNYHKVVPTCNVRNDCISEEMFQVRWLAPNHADIRVPKRFERQGIFKCVTTEVRDDSTCSWPPLGKTDLLSRLLTF